MKKEHSEARLSSLMIHLAFALAASLMITPPAGAQAPTPQSVINNIRSAKILGKDISDSLAVRIAGSEITVSAYVGPKSSDQDSKIDAVLIAKELVSKYRSIKFVRVVFSDINDPNKYRSIVVRAGDIDLYGSGALSKENLFKMINVAHERRPSSNKSVRPEEEITHYRVVPGFHEEDREQTLINLKKIAKARGNVSDLWVLFKQIEEMVKNYKTEEVVEPFNHLNWLIGQRTDQVNANIEKRNEEFKRQMYLQENKLQKAEYRLGAGYAYRRRMAVKQAIEERTRAGADMSWYQKRLIYQIEPLARADRDHARVDDMLGEMERALKISPETSY